MANRRAVAPIVCRSLGGLFASNSIHDEDPDFDSRETAVAGGAGFRYLISRRFGIHSGLDVARGPEETAFYIVFGSAWVK